MEIQNKIINGMWIGNVLSKMELLTIRSFISNGHHFRLWVYDSPEVPMLDGLEVRDAREIISEEYVFSYKNKNKFGHGKGSYAGFSDIFRYKLLYQYGGWWVDMDVTCLRPFDFASPYIFRSHHELDVVGNVMKCPKGAPVMLSSYEEANREINGNNEDWHKPIEILNKYIKHYDLKSHIKSDLSYEDDWRIISKFIKSNSKALDLDYYFIHWLNEEWRARQLSKNIYRYKSILGELMLKYGVADRKFTTTQKMINYFKTSEFYENLRLLNVIE